MNDVHIGSHSYLSHSIIGRGSVIGPHFSTIPGNATIEIEGEFNKLENIGAMIGEDCEIGNNTVIEPGILVGRKCVISPLTRVNNNLISGQNVM
jgi:NDP-sugar pyrophosphorylase family protein